MIPILTFDMVGAATSSGLFESVVPRVALKLRPTRGPAQGVWSRAPARHYLWVRPDLFFSGESHTCRTRSHRRCLRGRSWSRSSWRGRSRVLSCLFGVGGGRPRADTKRGVVGKRVEVGGGRII